MSSRCIAFLLLALLAGAASIPAQSIISYDGLTSSFLEAPAISPAFPMGAPPGPPIPLGPPLPPSLPPLGACTLDNTTGIIYVSDGMTISAMNHPAYPALVNPPPPFAAPGIIGGPVTCMALDPVGAPGGILYVGSFLGFIGISPLPPHATIIPSWGIAGVPGGITGMDWDPFSLLLVGTDPAGGVYHIPVGLAGIPAMIIGPPPFVPPGANSLAMDKTAGPSPTRIYVGFPGLVIEYMSPGAPYGFPSNNDGLTWHGLPATLPGSTSCGPGFPLPTLTATGPAVTGSTTFGLTFGNMPVGETVILMFDLPPFAFLPSGIPFSSGVLYLNPFFSPTFLAFPFGTATIATFTLPTPLIGVTPGLTLIAQAAITCPGPPFIALTEALQVAVGLP